MDTLMKPIEYMCMLCPSLHGILHGNNMYHTWLLYL